MTDYILTEPTELTKLRLPTDWISNQKILTTKSFPLTPLPSPLLLFPFNNFFATLVSSYNPFCLGLDSKSKVDSCYSLSSIGTMEQSMKQGVERGSF